MLTSRCISLKITATEELYKNLRTPASCSISMLPHWHPSNDIDLEVVHFLEYCSEKLSNNDKVPSLPAHGGDGIHNTVVFEDLIWSPVASPWCLEYILL